MISSVMKVRLTCFLYIFACLFGIIGTVVLWCMMDWDDVKCGIQNNGITFNYRK